MDLSEVIVYPTLYTIQWSVCQQHTFVGSNQWNKQLLIDWLWLFVSQKEVVVSPKERKRAPKVDKTECLSKWEVWFELPTLHFIGIVHSLWAINIIPRWSNNKLVNFGIYQRLVHYTRKAYVHTRKVSTNDILVWWQFKLVLTFSVICI